MRKPSRSNFKVLKMSNDDISLKIKNLMNMKTQKAVLKNFPMNGQ